MSEVSEQENGSTANLSVLKDEPEIEELVLPVPVELLSSLNVVSQSQEKATAKPNELFLREWSPMEELLSRIPIKAQKGLTTLDLKLTCVAASAEFIALGTNVGLVYWYNRKLDQLDRLKTETSNSPITVISLISTVDFMLAAGNKDGLITIFQIPKPQSYSNGHEAKTTQRFRVADLHQSIVTALEWSNNGMKLFSGDATGTVVLTDVDYELGVTKSRNLIDEESEIVQLSYEKKYLLVCSTLCSIIYSLATTSIYRVGTQERKMQGRFGGIFLSSAFNQSPKLYSVRPGGRIWLADSNGVVEHTIKFKDLLLQNSHPRIPVINPTSAKNLQLDFQIGVLHRFMNYYLATSYNDILFIIDPVNTRVIGSCHELRSIVDISVSESEIFILESDRKLIRISAVPDSIQSCSDNYSEFFKGVGMIPNIMSASIADFRMPQEPISFITSKLKKTSRALPKINSSFLNTLKNVIEIDIDVQDGQLTVIPPVIPLRESDIPNIVIDETVVYNFEEGQVPSEMIPSIVKDDKFEHISNQPFEDVLAQPLRKNKSKKKSHKMMDSVFQLSGDIGTSDAISLSSTYSTNSEGDVSNTARKLSSHSDSAHSANENASSGSRIVPDQFFSVNMSQSWSIGQISGFQEVSISDLETKEEILARKLKWPELLPESAKHIVLEDLEHYKNNINLSDRKDDDNNLFQLDVERQRDSETPDDDGLDGGSSIVTLKDIRSSNKEIDNTTLSMSSLVSSLPLEEELYGAFNYNATDNGFTPDQEMNSNFFDQSIDIYTKYAPYDESNTGSISSALSFGPPSENSSFSNVQNFDEIKKQPSIKEMDKDNNIPTYSGISVAYEDLMQVRDMVVDPIVIENDSWVSYKSPSSLQSIAVCDSLIICTDTKNNVYYSHLGDVSLRWILTEYQAFQMAISPCGSVVWRLFKGTLYSLMNSSVENPIGSRNGEWSKISNNVISMTVRVHIGWIVKTDGTVHICSNLGESSMIPEFERIPCSWPLSQICALDNMVWAVTLEGKVIYRTGITDINCQGKEWIEKRWEPEIPSVRAFSIGPSNTIWIADSQNNLYFLTGVTSQSFGDVCPWKVSFGEFTLSNGSSTSSRNNSLGNDSNGSSGSFSFNSFKNRLSDFRPDRIASRLTSKSFPILVGTCSSIWYSSSGSVLLNVSKTQVEGHTWSSIKLDRVIKGSTWTNLHAGSIYLDHGYLWIMDSKGKLFYCNQNGGNPKPIDLPCSSEIICLTPAPDALWILNTEGIVYGRCNISSVNPIGYGWDKIDLSTLTKVHFVHVSCGSDVAWACDNRGNIFMRVGSLRPPGHTDNSPVWVPVEGSPNSSKNCIFTQVYVGTNGSMVWALDNLKNIYVREAIYPDYPIGIRWLLVSGIEAVKLAVSDKAVWALSPQGKIFRRYGISTTNFVGDYWKKVPGNVKVLTVSLCDKLWALDICSQLIKHSQETLNFNEKERKKSKVELDPEDKDWEFVESL